jgi:hypothetical protein
VDRFVGRNIAVASVQAEQSRSRKPRSRAANDDRVGVPLFGDLQQALGRIAQLDEVFGLELPGGHGERAAEKLGEDCLDRPVEVDVQLPHPRAPWVPKLSFPANQLIRRGRSGFWHSRGLACGRLMR